CLELGLFCYFYRQRYTAATGFFRAAFTVEPKLAEHQIFQHRSLAFSAALRAAAGQGENATGLNAEERSKLRQQALERLQVDVAVCGRLAENKDLRQKVRERLSSWLRDGDLVLVREAKALAALPEPERKAWQQFWEDVAALLKRSR